MGNLAQGLILSVIGMTITFIALGLVILAMVVLKRLFPPRPLVSDIEDLDETQFVRRRKSWQLLPWPWLTCIR